MPLPQSYLNRGGTRVRYSKAEADFICDKAADNLTHRQITDCLNESGVAPKERTYASVEYFIRRVLKKLRTEKEYNEFFAQREGGLQPLEDEVAEQKKQATPKAKNKKLPLKKAG